MRWYKRVAAVLLAGIVIMALLGGCGQEKGSGMVMEIDPEEKEAVSATINFFGYKVDAINLVAMESALRDFMEIHPDIVITYEGLKGQTYWDAFEKRIESGNLDDIFTVDHDHIMALREEGRLADLSGLSTIDNYSDLAKSQFMEEDGSVYYLPSGITTYSMYANLDLLEENGLEVPTNYTEFCEACSYFADKGITPIIINNFNSFRSLVVAKSMYQIYQKDDPVAEIQKFNSGEIDLAETLRPGMELAAHILDEGWIDKEEALVTAQTSDDLDLFVKGDRPFMISGGWASPRVAAQNPGFEYAVYPLPVLEDGSVLVMEMFTCISVNADSPYLEETLEFMDFFTQPDVTWKYCDSQSSFTAMKDDRIPGDSTVVPSTPGLSEGKMMIGCDNNLVLPMDSSLRECGIQMMKGMDLDEAMLLLADLLSAENAG